MKKYFLFLLYSVVSFSQIPAYYSGIDFTQTGNNLKNQLATLITNTHTNQLSYTPGVWNALQSGDLNPSNSSQVLLIYGFNDVDAIYKNDRTDLTTNICSSTCPTGSWNREHCYALSLGTPALVTSSPGPGTDAHHIRAADVTFNADRGNRPYADGSGDAGPIGASNWYPGDEWKGDIARMMMYMFVRYNTRCLATNVGSGATTYNVDMPDIFLEWNKEDPVSPYEKTRNNVLQGIQGNRNPFIDNPYLATVIWGGPQAPDAWNIIGCTTTTTWNGTTWSNGTPNKGIKAIFNGNFTSSGNLDMCSMDVIGTAQVTLQSNHIFTIVRNINVASTANFTVQNNANLVQINNIANSGNITLIKNSANLLRLDYTAWSSPVSNQNLLAFSPQTLTNRFYIYNPAGTSTPSAYTSINPSSTSFNPTTGYLIRSPNNWSSTVSSPYVGQFTGIPNNGEFYTAIQQGYNLVGNPFPATIEGSHFIASNRTIETLYFWTHTAPASGGIYPVNNYASYTTLGGVAAAAGGAIPDGSIKPGQGFYFYSSENENVFFHNALRYNIMNTQFFRTNSFEKDIYRLNLSDSYQNYNQILIGYDANATEAFDIGIDGKAFEYDDAILFTTIDNNKYVIQGRPTFDSNDKLALGVKIKSDGFYTVQLENKEGVFNQQPIYLKDNFNGSITEISKQPYTFSSTAGSFTTRFELMYQLEKNSVKEHQITVLNHDTEILINSSSNMQLITVYDLLGKKIYELNKTTNEAHLPISKNNQIVLLEIHLEDGSIQHHKVIQ